MAVLNWGGFNESFFENANNKVKWFDKKGILLLKNGLMATIRITTHGTADHYEGYEVEIKGKDNVIDKHYFPFNAYLGEGNTYADGKMVGIITYCCKTSVAEWYGKDPEYKKVDIMAKEIIDYINEFAKIQ